MLALMMLAHGTRIGETRMARWSEISLAAAEWFIPAGNTKTRTEHRLPLTGTVLMVSGRASFELVQKASMAGIPVLAAVSAPSSLAVDLAADTGLTLLGFVRDDAMVAYARADRVRSREDLETAAFKKEA